MSFDSITAAAGCQLLDEVKKQAQLWDKVSQEFADKARQVLPYVPGGLRKVAKENLDKYVEMRDQAAKLHQKYLFNLLTPCQLMDIAEAWRTDIYDGATEVKNVLETKHLGVDNYWQGSAATSYKNMSKKQSDSSNEVALLAKNIGDSVSEVSNAIIDFLVSVSGGLVACLTFIVATVGLLAGGVTAPAAIVTAIGAIISLIYTWVQADRTISAQIRTINQAVSDFKAERQNNTTFSGDSWPKATISGQWAAD